MRNKSSADSPILSLPKGGGTINGVGETFQPNLFSGTGNFTIPITTSSGREGFGPQLALQYSSGNGNGLFGLGWQLSIPRITRKTEKGLPRYDDNDTFIMSGAEDLVLCLKEVETPDHPEQIEWVPEEPLAQGEFTITRYRPRTEGLFARIEQWVHSDAEVHWRAITKANVTSIYGRTSAAQIADPEKPHHIFEWLLEESFDAKGNHIRYEYAQELPNPQLLPAISEQNRDYRSQRYIRRIYYGNTPDSLVDEKRVGPVRDGRHYVFEILFDYGDCPLNPLESYLEPPQTAEPERATAAWTQRQDAFSSYRAGFEVRTLRRCRRVMMFHHFAELSASGKPKAATLVKSTDFLYRPHGETHLSFLESATVNSYRWDVGEGDFKTAAMPPVTFQYSEFRPDEQRYQSLTAAGDDLPALALSHPDYGLVDLDGNGLPDILHTAPTGFRYWPNKGNGHFGRSRLMQGGPLGVTLSQPEVRLTDMAGDGRADLLVHNGTINGFFETTAATTWQTFKHIHQMPSFNFDDPNTRLVDLTGDGRSDILVSRDHHFLWFECLGEDGYGEPQFIEREHDLNRFPDLYFNDPSGRVQLADMSGDGLNDMVLLHNGRIDYWPNLGYGKFGQRITMADAPHLPYNFDPARLFLTDVDGSGCADLVYVDFDCVYFWFNRSGNGWSAQHVVHGTPLTTNNTAVQFADIYGTGTAALLWSYPHSQFPNQNYKVLDFCGGRKPYLLIEMDNHLGATTRVQYASSTKFCLADEAENRPWVSKLPFPVQVVEKIEVIDHISQTKLVTAYQYHHGYFDGREREFRGFGRVDQLDTERFENFSQEQLHDAAVPVMNAEPAFHVPPVLTKNWFHTGIYYETEENGAYVDEQTLLHRYRREYYQNDLDAPISGRNLVPLEEEPHAAYRALRGALLRSEVFALDDSEQASHPYLVSESVYEVVQIQGMGDNHHAVFQVRPHNSVSYHYERNPQDPRIVQSLTLATDVYGNITRSAAIAYPRRPADTQTVSLSEDEAQAVKLQQLLTQRQQQRLITVTQNDYVEPVGEDSLGPYRHSIVCETQVYELTAVPAPASTLYTKDEINTALNDAAEIAYHARPSMSQFSPPEKRLIEQQRILFWNDDLTAAMPLKQVAAHGLAYQTYQLAFPETPQYENQTLLQTLFDDQVTDTMVVEGGYYQSDGSYWAADGHLWQPSSTSVFEATQFYLPVAQQDPFGNVTQVTYDVYALLPVTVVDPLGNTTAVEDEQGHPRHNYRVLQPEALKDPNGNVVEVLFDTRGLVIATAVKGKGAQGDTLEGVVVEPTAVQLQDPVAHEQTLLGSATTRIVYNFEAQPAFAHNLSRETHQAQLEDGAETRVLHLRVYSDGFGRAVQSKASAEAGPVPLRDDDHGAMIVEQGRPQMSTTDAARWVTSGWTIFNNKGKPVQQYEPFFSDQLAFEFDVRLGVSSTLFYDPLERVVAILHPDHTYEKVRFRPWQQVSWDRNDTVLLRPQDDPDIQGYVVSFIDGYRHPLDERPFSSWYDVRIPDRQNLPSLNSATAEQRAALKTAEHATTPATAYLDTLGRPFLTIADNQTEKLATLVELDVEGNDLSITDPRLLDHYLQWLVAQNEDAHWSQVELPQWRKNFQHGFDVVGRKLLIDSADAGLKKSFLDVLGQPLYTWDARGQQTRVNYDALRRPLELWVRVPDQQGILGSFELAEKTIYGEAAAEAQANLKGQIWQIYDGAGLGINEAFDFKGNLLRTTRRLLENGQEANPRWPTDSTGNFAAHVAAAELQAAAYTTHTQYDALNRVIRSETADGTIQESVYNAAGLLEQVQVTHHGQVQHFVSNIDYDEQGRRTQIHYGNGVVTNYEYGPNTFRLSRLVSRRADGTVLQALSYSYDPMGNITHIVDGALPVIFNHNQQIKPESHYTYDALYRLLEASGREHEAMGACHYQKTTQKQTEVFALSSQPTNNGQALRNYTERYRYDKAGNLLEMRHIAGATGSWTRTQTFAEQSNRLATSNANCLNEDGFDYGGADHSDANGNLTAMPHLSKLHWNYADWLTQVEYGVGATAVYQYDAAGQRVRKTIVENGTVKERIYLSGYEIYEVHNGSSIALRRDTIHIMDDQNRIALLEDEKAPADSAQLINTRTRYQLANHLGSSTLELDDSQTAKLISYEEYYPYGGTAYVAGPNQVDVQRKRYRYSGKERDDETGLYYYGARYYAPWLARWVSCDPIGSKDDFNLYLFVKANPIRFADPNGLETKKPEAGADKGDATRGGKYENTREHEEGEKVSFIIMGSKVSKSDQAMSNVLRAAKKSKWVIIHAEHSKEAYELLRDYKKEHKIEINNVLIASHGDVGAANFKLGDRWYTLKGKRIRPQNHKAGLKNNVEVYFRRFRRLDIQGDVLLIACFGGSPHNRGDKMTSRLSQLFGERVYSNQSWTANHASMNPASDRENDDRDHLSFMLPTGKRQCWRTVKKYRNAIDDLGKNTMATPDGETTTVGPWYLNDDGTFGIMDFESVKDIVRKEQAQAADGKIPDGWEQPCAPVRRAR